MLIVSPAFHGYWRPIEAAFRRLGWDASSYCYDDAPSLSAKVAVKVRGELRSRLGGNGEDFLARVHSEGARAAVESRRPDRVLVIKGDTLSERFIDALNRSRIPRTLWLYDELRRTRHTDVSLLAYDSIASYSAQDTLTLNGSGRAASHVPLAFDADLELLPRHTNDVVFIGARYPQREHVLEHLQASGVRVRAYGRQWSDHPFDRLRTWRVTAPGIPTGRDLSRREAYGLTAGAPAVLNVHGDQDGFTMRTFEAAGAGGVQLIDRADVGDLYTPGEEVVCFNGPEDLADAARKATRDDRWGDRIRKAARHRTLAEHTFDHRARALEASWA